MENLLYSYKKNYPQELPFSLSLDNGLTITEIKNLSDEQLQEYGFEGPYEIPVYDKIEENLVWTGDGFSIIRLDKNEIIFNILNSPYIFSQFFEEFKETNLFSSVEENISSDLLLKLKYTEFFLLEEKLIKKNSIYDQNENINLLFSCINFFYNYFDLDELSKNEIKSILINSKLDNFNRLYELNSYSSWILQEDGASKLSPVPYPTDGKEYEWNESIRNWVEI